MIVIYNFILTSFLNSIRKWWIIYLFQKKIKNNAITLKTQHYKKTDKFQRIVSNG